MNTNQAINYLEGVNEIPTRDMSKAMFRFLRAAARCALREYPGMRGYYDPEYEGPRADANRFRFAPAATTVPQSLELQYRILARRPDPFRSASYLF